MKYLTRGKTPGSLISQECRTKSIFVINMVGLVKPGKRTSGSTDTFPLGEKSLRAGIEQRAKG